MITNKVSLLKVNAQMKHKLKDYVSIRGDYITTTYEDEDGVDQYIEAWLNEGVTVNLIFDERKVSVEALDTFRDYLGELEELYEELVAIFSPINNNDNSK